MTSALLVYQPFPRSVPAFGLVVRVVRTFEYAALLGALLLREGRD